MAIRFSATPISATQNAVLVRSVAAVPNAVVALTAAVPIVAPTLARDATRVVRIAALQIVARDATRVVRIAALQIVARVGTRVVLSVVLPIEARDATRVVQLAALQLAAFQIVAPNVVRLSVLRYAARASFAELTLFLTGPVRASPFPPA